MEKRLSLRQATAINMIDMVGIGPFITFPMVMSMMNGPYFLYAWVAGAFLSFMDAMVWGELGAAFPMAGGSYNFLKEAYNKNGAGKLMRFLLVWQTMIQAPLVIASAAIGFALYFSYLVPLAPLTEKIVSGSVVIAIVLLLYRGSNASINVIYSGTMSAAMEGIPSAGFSLQDFNFEADFSVAKKVAHTVTQRMLAERMPEHFLLNVNIPKVKEKAFKGIKICRQTDAKWAENFDKRKDPRGRDYYWMTGKFINRDRGEDTDIEALNAGYASIVPICIDFTDDKIKHWLQKRYPDFE